MKRFLTLALLASLAFAQPAYYPHGVGYSWKYSSGEEQVFAREQNGLLVLERRFPKRPIIADLLRYTDSGGVLLEGLMVGQQVQRYTPALQLYPNPPLYVGQRWGGRSKLGKQTIALFGEVNRIEGVSVAAGRFNAFVIRNSTVTGEGGSVVVEIYYVPGVGIVRYATTDGGTIDLVQSSVPK